MYTSYDVANKFLELAERDGISLSPMKLLKLVYIAHGFHLGVKGTPLISSRIEAWQYGPVIPDLYKVLRVFGNRPVIRASVEIFSDKELKGSDAEFVELIWNMYRDMSAVQLSARTHEVGTPWELSFNEYEKHIPITNDTIQEYYKSLLSETATETV